MSKQTAGILAVGLAHITWGFTTPALKIALFEIPSFSALFIRFLIASLIILPIFLLRPYKKADKAHLVEFVFLTLIGVSLHMVLFVVGLDLSKVVFASLIIATVPVMDVLAAKFFLGEKISFVHRIGLVIALLGTLILILEPIFFGKEAASVDLLGNLALFLSMILSALFVIGIKKLSSYYTPLTIGTYTSVIATLSFLPFAAAETLANPHWIGGLSLQAILAIAFAGVFASFVAYLSFEWGISRAQIQLIAPLNYLTPLVSIALGVLVLKEQVDSLFFISGAVILLGVFLGTFQKPQHHLHRRHKV